MLIGTEDCKNFDSAFLSQGGKGSEEVYPANSMMITDRINKVGSLISDTPMSMLSHQC